MAPPLSGSQVEIRHGRHRAVLVEVGGGLREYHLDDWPVLDGYALDSMADGGRGQPLLPWPNRLEDGQYAFGGLSLRLPVDDLVHRNAMHGLVRWSNWHAEVLAPHSATMRLRLHPRPGYPFTLDLAIAYVLSEAGLTVRTSAHNLGDGPAPLGAGQHPYFSVGDPAVDASRFHLHARSYLVVDGRNLPTGERRPTAGSDLDFRAPRAVGSLRLDACYADLERGADGRAVARLIAADGRREVAVWMDEHYRYVQVYSGDTLVPERRRASLAIEPMTCPPNALRSGEDLVVLAPGERFEAAWGISPGTAPAPASASAP